MSVQRDSLVHGMIWLGRDLKDNPVSMVLPWTGTPSIKGSLPELHQPDLEILQGWGTHSISGQLFLVLHHPHSK